MKGYMIDNILINKYKEMNNEVKLPSCRKRYDGKKKGVEYAGLS